MKIFVVFAAIIIASVLADDAVYDTSKFDNIDIDAILKNDRLLQNHLNCLTDGKGCTPESEELKSKIYSSIKIAIRFCFLHFIHENKVIRSS